jgi:hypothetical protein
MRGDKKNISNYRGVSILLAISKLFEKLVCDVITPIIRPSISDEQHGIVGGCCRVTSLVEFSSFVLNKMEVDAVYTDFSKAFDRVNHVIGHVDSEIPSSDDFWVGEYLYETIYCH